MVMNARILIVEDDPCSRTGLRDLLRADGYLVEACADGLQGFRLFRAQPFDLAFVDLNLPAVLGVPISGWDFIRMLRAYLPNLPVIILTAEELTAVHVAEAKSLRVAAMLHKPVTPSRLKHLIVSVLARLGEPTVPAAAIEKVPNRYRRTLKKMLAPILVGVLFTPS